MKVERIISSLPYAVVSIIFLLFIVSNISYAEGVPACLSQDVQTNTESIIDSHPMSDQELLARLVYAEGLSTGFGDDRLVYDSIAWGVMNRVRLGKVSHSIRRAYGFGIRGVIFKKGQFNPAVSKRSQFSKAFLCPDHASRWTMAQSAADTAMKGAGNPFIQKSWERQNNLSLVVNFYYPHSIQAQGRFAPWEGNKSLIFIGDLPMGDTTLSAEHIRFYRLKYPPTDIKKHEKIH
ncbi:MAG: hypothetical protein ABFD82_17460 [Syntrophaceae bacterium]